MTVDLRVPGLDGPVDVVRDRFGVPHCRTVSEHDAFFAQGFVHAADRLWQLDYDRRRGLGRAAEAVGPPGVVGDVLYRRVDLAAGARRDLAGLSAAARDMLDAYAAGVNAWLAQLATPGTAVRMPREFTVPGLPPPEPWAPWHSLVVYRTRHLTMGSAAAKLWRAVVGQHLGQAAARKMASGRSREQVACVPPGARCQGAVPSWTGLEDSGSNNWALAGSRTESGLPLLAGDPHRPLEAPNVYVQGHVACPDWDVLGLAIPGVPGFSHFGHNERVAWCITHAMADDQDLYQDPPPLGRRAEVIQVRSGDPVHIEAAASDRGPLISGEFALAWTAIAAPNAGFDALPAMLRARSVGELFETMRPWVEPANNLLAADRDGSIGYLTRGKVPIRTGPAAAWGPVPGADPSYRWRGWVSHPDMPQARDPDEGFLFSANNRIQAADSGPYLGLDVAAPWRATRIVDRLSNLSGATVEDMAALHRDVTSLPGQRIAKLLSDWAPLAGWHGQMVPESTAAAAYSVLRRELALIVLERSGLAGQIEHRWNRLLPGVRAESVVWRVAGDHLEAGDESLLGGWSWRQALTEAIRRAEHAWKGQAWGELHAIRPKHPLGRAELDPPEVPYGGDMDTVQASSYFAVQGLRTVSASVARYAFDLADWDHCGWVVPLGAAGEPGTRHSCDQQEAWRTGRLVPAPYSWPAVQAAAEERSSLTPG